jgi:beta-galactosidase
MWIFDSARISSMLPGDRPYDSAFYKIYRMFFDQNISRDIIYPDSGVEAYKVVFSPFLPVISYDLLDKMKKYVINGGTWVVGPLSACRNEDAATNTTSSYGALEALSGVHVRHRFQPKQKETSIRFGKRTVKCDIWCDAYELKGKNCRPLAVYSNGPAKGMPAVVECAVGKGRIILAGTHFDDSFYPRFIKDVCEPFLAGDVTAGKGVTVVERVDASGKTAGYIAVNVTARRNRVIIGKKATTIAPFDVIFINGGK